MLARRLMVFALVVLVVTAVSSALVPPRRTVAPPAPADARASDGDSVLIERTVDAAEPDPPTITISAGDRLRLTVESGESGAISLEGIGDLRAVASGTDAVFDVLPMRPGDYPVLLVEDRRTIATVRVVGDR